MDAYLEQAFVQAAAIDRYWNFLIAVGTAVLGIMASGKGFTTSRLLKVILSATFIIVALSNLDAIRRLTIGRNALLDAVPEDIPAAIIASLRPGKFWQYACFHLVLDAAVLGLIWFAPWARPDAELSEPQPSEKQDPQS